MDPHLSTYPLTSLANRNWRLVFSPLLATTYLTSFVLMLGPDDLRLDHTYSKRDLHAVARQ